MERITLTVPKRYHTYLTNGKSFYLPGLEEHVKSVRVKFDSNTITINGPKNDVEIVRKEVIATVENYLKSICVEELAIDPKHGKQILKQTANKFKDEYRVAIIISDEKKDSVRIEGLKTDVQKAKVSLEQIIHRIDQEVERDIKIAPEYHRSIVGRKGDRIREIQKEFDVIIQFPSQGQRDNLDVVKVRGLDENVKKCQYRLCMLSRQASKNRYTLELRVYKPFYKYISGKGKSVIESIENETGTKIRLSKKSDDEEYSENEDEDDEDEDDEKAIKTNDNVVFIVGKQDNVHRARDQIDKLQNEMECVVNKEVTVSIRYHAELKELFEGISIKCGDVQITCPDSDSNSDKVTIRGPKEDVNDAKIRLLIAVDDLKKHKSKKSNLQSK